MFQNDEGGFFGVPHTQPFVNASFQIDLFNNHPVVFVIKFEPEVGLAFTTWNFHWEPAELH